MNEEEKRAIELLKQEPDFSLSYYKREHAIDIVLNLIEKQQKEIYRLNRKQADDEMLKDTFIERDYISKDKIKEKLKEIEEQKEKLKYDGNRCFADYEQFCKNSKFFKEQIEELLEEN